ncbi:MAG: hypothetical protein M3290_02480, partial [Actinomycetota bacterium]|nr:hypothetical protein [Actinomycetota bacterium]
IGPKDHDAAALVVKCAAGEVASSPDEAAEILTRWLGEFRRGGQIDHHVDASALQEYEWRNISRRLAEVFERVTARELQRQ